VALIFEFRVWVVIADGGFVDLLCQGLDVLRGFLLRIGRNPVNCSVLNTVLISFVCFWKSEVNDQVQRLALARFCPFSFKTWDAGSWCVRKDYANTSDGSHRRQGWNSVEGLCIIHMWAFKVHVFLKGFSFGQKWQTNFEETFSHYLQHRILLINLVGCADFFSDTATLWVEGHLLLNKKDWWLRILSPEWFFFNSSFNTNVISLW